MSCKTGYRSHAKAPGNRSEASSCQVQACVSRHSGYTPEITAYHRHFCPWSQIANRWSWWSWFCWFCCSWLSCCCCFLSQKETQRGIRGFSESAAKAKKAGTYVPQGSCVAKRCDLCHAISDRNHNSGDFGAKGAKSQRESAFRNHRSQCKEVDPEFQPGNPADVQENHGYHKGC